MEVASALHPAVGILNGILKEVQAVHLNKRKLHHLVERCHRVIVTINEELAKRPPCNVDNSIRQLIRHLSWIRDMISTLARLGYLKSMMRKEDIGRQILDGHHRLSDCLAVFQITAAVDVCEYMGALNRAAEEDRDALYAQLRVLERNDHEVMRRFDVMENQVEAMMAIQNNLLRKLDNSPEQRILKVGLKALQKSSGQNLPIKRPDWSITRFDIEIDPDGQLGNGGFGSVKKGKWGKVVVAIKEINQVTDPEMLIKEIEVWSRLRHDHILPFYGASAEASPPFIVSRYMANGHIMKYLSLHPDANRVQLVHEIALGMLFIHSKGIVHGDLKAVNVLIDDTTKACIADFGLSRVVQPQPYTGQSTVPGTEYRQIAGTLRYMSPEALSGDIGKMSDVYAFAMTLYEVFTNEPPFMLIPDSDLYELITTHHKRLIRPFDLKVIDRGFNGGMWNLVWHASEPAPLERPEFAEITEITERLAEERLESLKEGSAVVGEERSWNMPAFQLELGRASPKDDQGFDSEYDVVAKHQPGDALSERRSAEPVASEPRQAPSLSDLLTIPLLIAPENGVAPQVDGLARPDTGPWTHDQSALIDGLDSLLQTGPSAFHLVPPMRPNGGGPSITPTGNLPETAPPLISLAIELNGPQNVYQDIGLTTQPPVNTRVELNRLSSMSNPSFGFPHESEARRQSVILSIIGKEERYLQRLNYLDGVFFKAIQRADPPVIPRDELQGFMTAIFWNVSELRDTSRRLLKNLYARQKEQQPNIQIIGDILLEASKAFIRGYPSYIGHLPIAQRRLQAECDRNATFRSFVQRAAHHADGRQLDLWHFLTRPSDYIEYFPSLLEKLMHHTRSESTDVDFLYETGQVIRSIGDLARLWTFQYGPRDSPDIPTDWNELVCRDVQEALPKNERKKQRRFISKEMTHAANLEAIDKVAVPTT
ncbi:hypothetical protein FRB96_004233 [Tulasnella sp. 330]|nr:hypothetical protein FRB96_004233 [Tulasnella sp. 330]